MIVNARFLKKPEIEVNYYDNMAEIRVDCQVNSEFWLTIKLSKDELEQLMQKMDANFIPKL